MVTINNIKKAKRILIQGSSGGGKSTLAKELGQILNLPVIHLDKEYWQPGWVKPNSSEWHALQIEFINRESWIIEGGIYKKALPLRVQAADLVIFLELNRFLCFYRAIKRFVMNKVNKSPNVATGCTEKFDLLFAKWMLHEQPSIENPLAIKTIHQNLNKAELVILKTPKEVRSFMETSNCKILQRPILVS